MSEIRVTVRDTYLDAEAINVVSGAIGTVPCIFDFDESWDGYAKTVVFYKGSENQIKLSKTVSLLSNETSCDTPFEVLLSAEPLYIGLYGTKDNKVKPTNWSIVNLPEGTYSANTLPPPASPDVYVQLLNKQNELQQRFENVLEGITDDSEVKTARGSYKLLPDRLNAIEYNINLKRDKDAKITSADLDTSSNANKIHMINLADDVKQAMAGTTQIYASIENGGVTTEKYADNSITLPKLSAQTLTAYLLCGETPPDYNTSTKVFDFKSPTQGIQPTLFYGNTYYIIPPNTTVTNTVASTTASKLIFNTESNEFCFIPYTTALAKNEVLVCVVRTNGIKTYISGSFPYTLNGGSFINGFSVRDAKIDNNFIYFGSNTSFTTFEEKNTIGGSVYFKYDGNLAIRGFTNASSIISDTDLTWADIVAFINDTSRFVKSPNGIENCLEVKSTEMLIIDIADKTLKIISRNDFNNASQINLLYVVDGSAKFGLLAQEALRQKINRLETTTLFDSVPSYWRPTLDQKITTINTYQQSGRNSFSFIFITDIHNVGSCQNEVNILKYVSDKCAIKHILNGGDFATDGALNTKQQTLDDILNAHYRFKSVRDRMLIAEGNHDAAYSTLGSPNYYKQNLNKNEIYSALMRPMTQYFNPIFGNDNYYFVDDPLNKVRYICLLTQDKDYAVNEDGSAVDNKMWNFAIRQEQLTWLAETALNVPDSSWSVVIFSHVPPAFAGENAIANCDLVLQILNAFNNKSSFSGIGTNTQYPASIFVDFTNKGGNVIGWFAGHLHLDTFNYYFDIACISSLNNNLHVNSGAPAKAKGTITELAFDVVTVDKDSRTVYLTRIGAGEDRSFAY